MRLLAIAGLLTEPTQGRDDDGRGGYRHERDEQRAVQAQGREHGRYQQRTHRVPQTTAH